MNQLPGFDAIGCHWIDYALLKALGSEAANQCVTGSFGGNFWWSTAGYLRGLPPLEYDDRYKAEGWIGLDKPKILDLAPGWIKHPHA